MGLQFNISFNRNDCFPMSDSKTTKKSLFEEFPPVSTEEWEEVISRDLKGTDYKEVLRWQTGEGIDPLPFYRKEDFKKIGRKRPLEKTGKRSWDIVETIYRQDVTAANNAARTALDAGADSLQFYYQVLYTDGMLGGDLAGTAIQNQQHFTDLLENINLDKVTVHFDSGLATPVLLAMLHNEVQRQGVAPGQTAATFSYDPFRSILLNGRMPKNPADFQHDIYQMFKFSKHSLPGVRPLCVDARTYHNTGASLVQELGLAMAAASEYLATLTDHGAETTEAGKHLCFYFSAGSNYFLEIAKFRAARLLWEQLIEAYGGDASAVPAYLHGVTSRRNKSLYDPYNNILRTTTEGMSASIGGCDSITLRPFDEHFRNTDDFSERIARNAQVIMSEEAYLDKVKDPSAGSYYIEKLTDDIAREAWTFFQEVEKAGGIIKAIQDNFVQLNIEQSQKKRQQAIAKGDRVFVGTNKYPNPDDRMADKNQPDQPTVSLDAPDGEPEIDKDKLITELANALMDESDLKDFIPYLYDIDKHDIRQLAPFHETEPFEQLRMATEKHDTTPLVLTLPVGDPKIRKARSTFAGNFLGCAGYQIEDPIGFDSAEEALAQAVKKSPDIVVLCSSDENYKDIVPAATELFSDMEMPPLLVIAGNPTEDIRSLRKQGVDAFINSRSNILDTLELFHRKLGIIDS